MANRNYVSLSKLSTFLDNLKNTFAALSHEHTISDITDYVVDSELNSNSTNPVQNAALDAEFSEIALSMQALDLAIDSKQNVITGTDGQVVQINSDGNAVASDLNLITVEDIDVICGKTIKSANEVMF